MLAHRLNAFKSTRHTLPSPQPPIRGGGGGADLKYMQLFSPNPIKEPAILNSDHEAFKLFLSMSRIVLSFPENPGMCAFAGTHSRTRARIAHARACRGASFRGKKGFEILTFNRGLQF